MEKNIIEYITKFIKDNGSGELLKLWKSKEIQKDFKKSISENKGKTGKKKKAEGQPKNSKSAYMFFCQDKRSEIIERHEGIKPPQVLAALGKEWNLIKGDQSRISQYVLLAEEDKKRYKDEMAQFRSSPEVECDFGDGGAQDEDPLGKLSIKELKKQCKDKGLKGYSSLSKEELIAKLNE